MTEKNLENYVNPTQILKRLSVQDFRNFGVGQIAYVKAVKGKLGTSYEVCSADGETLYSSGRKELAMVMAKQNDLEPVVTH